MSVNSASLNEIAYNILNTLRGGRSSHSEHLDLDQIKFAINYYRSLFIRRDFARNFNRFRMFEQDLGVIDVDLYDTAEDAIEESLVDTLRSVKRIPTPIRMNRWEGITFVGTIDKNGNPFPVIDAHRNPWQKYAKYTSGIPEAFYRDGYIYLRNIEDIDVINIRGVFEDPEEVFEFTKSNALDLYNADSPYPIPTDMIQRITQGLINGELKVLISTPNDEELDNQQDSNPTG